MPQPSQLPTPPHRQRPNNRNQTNRPILHSAERLLGAVERFIQTLKSGWRRIKESKKKRVARRSRPQERERSPEEFPTRRSAGLFARPSGFIRPSHSKNPREPASPQVFTDARPNNFVPRSARPFSFDNAPEVLNRPESADQGPPLILDSLTSSFAPPILPLALFENEYFRAAERSDQF